MEFGENSVSSRNILIVANEVSKVHYTPMQSAVVAIRNRVRWVGFPCERLRAKLMAFLADAIFYVQFERKRVDARATRVGLNEWGQPGNIVFEETKMKRLGADNNINSTYSYQQECCHECVPQIYIIFLLLDRRTSCEMIFVILTS